MSAQKKAIKKLEKTIGIIDESLESAESRAFKERLRAAMAPYTHHSNEPSRSGRMNNYGDMYRTTRKGGKKSRKSRKSRGKKAHKKTHKR